MRINKFFTDRGICSRREADRAIQAGRVSLNGFPALLGDQVKEGDVVTLDGKDVTNTHKNPVILAYNKPVGIVCTTDEHTKDNLIANVNYPERVFNIGRLDQMSEGLLLLTNQGDIVNLILRSRYAHEKEYVVEVQADVLDEEIEKLRKGLFIEDIRTLPCVVERMGKRRVKMILVEGKNRQIRRMMESIGHKVSRLKRVRIMHIKLDDLPSGQWRKLTKKEEEELYKKLEISKI